MSCFNLPVIKITYSSCFVNTVVENAKKAYEKSSKFAEEKMSPTHPIRLGLALNFSVFHYEIADNRTKACELAKKVY